MALEGWRESGWLEQVVPSLRCPSRFRGKKVAAWGLDLLPKERAAVCPEMVLQLATQPLCEAGRLEGNLLVFNVGRNDGLWLSQS